MVFVPTFRDSDPEADPDVTEVYEPEVPSRTPIVALAWFLVGVTAIEVVALVTVTEKAEVDEANVGARVPDEMVKPDNVASFEGTAVVNAALLTLEFTVLRTITYATY